VEGQISVNECLCETQVARKVECCLKQKTGYDQHTSLSNGNPSIINILWKLKSDGKSEETIKNIGKCLRVLEKNAEINNPESVRDWIANSGKSEGYKRNLVNAYCHFVKFNGLTWNKPIYRESSKLPRIPADEKLNMIISASPKNLALKLLISMETGIRPVELMRLKVKDLDENGNIYPSTAKGGSPRVLKLTQRTTSLLRGYIAKYNLTDNLFKGKSEYYSKSYRRVRNNLAVKLNDPSIRNITLYHLRHHFATMLYNRTKDILHVQQKMGHRRLTTTLIYTQLIDNQSDEFTVKVANNINEASQLIESGFEFVATFQDKLLFRKRK
jgi:integrase